MKNDSNALVRAVLDYFALLRWPRWRNNTGAAAYPRRGGGSHFVRFGDPGAPDVLAVMPPHGRLVGVECKTGTGRLSEEQKAWRDNAEAAGALFVECRDVADLARVLEEAKK